MDGLPRKIKRKQGRIQEGSGYVLVNRKYALFLVMERRLEKRPRSCVLAAVNHAGAKAVRYTAF